MSRVVGNMTVLASRFTPMYTRRARTGRARTSARATEDLPAPSGPTSATLLTQREFPFGAVSRNCRKDRVRCELVSALDGKEGRPRLMSVSSSADLDLHGVVGVRLLDARAEDVRRVERQLGLAPSEIIGEPDITVRFVDAIEPRGSLTYVGLDDAGFDESAFYVLRGRHKTQGKVLIPFDEIGGSCHIVCERGLPQVPLLLGVINMTALAKGVLPLHASAFIYRGLGILAAGWAKGGKTELLLAFMEHGAKYVGDEWVYIDPDRRMFGIPEPIRLWRWQLAQLPVFAARLSGQQRFRLSALDALSRGVEAITPPGSTLGLPGSVLRRAAPVISRQVNVQIPPARLFGADSVALQAELERVFLLSSQQDTELRLDRIPGREVAARMVASNDAERDPLMSYYRQFRFAFPGRRSHILERAGQIEAGLLRNLLAGLPATWLRHPYPVSLASLYEAAVSELG
jgi:hypothetical protein